VSALEVAEAATAAEEDDEGRGLSSPAGPETVSQTAILVESCAPSPCHKTSVCESGLDTVPGCRASCPLLELEEATKIAVSKLSMLLCQEVIMAVFDLNSPCGIVVD